MSLLSSFTVTENDNDKIYNQLNAESSESFNVNDKNKCNDKNATVVNINNYNNAIKQMLPNKVLEDLIRKNLINSNINLLDPILNRVAYELVQAAIKSPRWIDIGKRCVYIVLLIIFIIIIVVATAVLLLLLLLLYFDVFYLYLFHLSI